MKVAVLEKTNFSPEQRERLESVASIDYFENISQDEANVIAPKYDIVVVNWLDPTPFILNMKSGALISLLSTGYSWIENIGEAYKKNILVSNIPSYSTEAVAEHLIGMLLGVSKNIFPTINKENNSVVGYEIKGKTVGVIGLGNIGNRFAELIHAFGANVITYNRTDKHSAIARDVELDYLLGNSDIICISCSVNETSHGLINMSNIEKIKIGATVIGSTWNIIDDSAMVYALENGIIKFLSFDAAIEANDVVSSELMKYSDRVFFTPHVAYNTHESQKRQLEICVDNILSFINGTPKNIVR